MFGIDGNAIDMATIAVGLVATVIRVAANFASTGYNRGQAIIDFLNGCTIVPFIALLASPFWTGILKLVLEAKVSMALAGGVGAFFLIGEFLPKRKPKNGTPASEFPSEPDDPGPVDAQDTQPTSVGITAK